MQSVTCPAADTCITADPGVASLILARSHALVADTCMTADPGVASSTFVEIDREIISTVILLPSTDSRRDVVSYKRKYVHKVLVNCLVNLAQEKSMVR